MFVDCGVISLRVVIFDNPSDLGGTYVFFSVRLSQLRTHLTMRDGFFLHPLEQVE